MSSVLHLLLFAMVHYMATVCPVVYKHIFHNSKMMKLMIGGVWTLPPLAFFATFFLMPGQGFQSNRCINSTAFFTWEFRLAVFCLLLWPLLLMTFLYFYLIYRLVFKQRHVRGDSLTASFRKKIRAIVTAFLILSSFLIAWLPGSIWYLLICDVCIIPLNRMNINIFVAASFLFNALMILKGLVNPLIYHMRIPELREALANFREAVFRRNQFATILPAQNQNNIGPIDSPTFGALASGIVHHRHSSYSI